MKKSVQIRLIILEILIEIYKKGINFENSYENLTKNKNISNSDRALINNVCLNSMRLQFHINKILSSFLKKESKLNQRILLLSAVTQLIYLNFKEYAVIYDSVEVAKKTNIFPGLINAVLKKIASNKKKLINTSIKLNDLPRWFVKNSTNLDKNDINIFLHTFYKEPNLHLVFKNESFLNIFSDKHVTTTEKSTFVTKTKKINELPNYKKGEWWVQDLSSMLPLYLSPEISGKTILDLCSAPGGKSFQAISIGGIVHANDINKKNIDILKSNLKRLRYKIKISNENALDINVSKKYEVILIDAPCTAVGTIRRNPEIFFKKTLPKINLLTTLQRGLLKKASSLLKSNGIIIYMVCSFLYEETEAHIDYFLKQNKEFSLCKFQKSKNQKKIQSLINNKGYILHAPKTYKDLLIDGFFAVKFKKNV